MKKEDYNNNNGVQNDNFGERIFHNSDNNIEKKEPFSNNKNKIEIFECEVDKNSIKKKSRVPKTTSIDEKLNNPKKKSFHQNINPFGKISFNLKSSKIENKKKNNEINVEKKIYTNEIRFSSQKFNEELHVFFAPVVWDNKKKRKEKIKKTLVHSISETIDTEDSGSHITQEELFAEVEERSQITDISDLQSTLPQHSFAPSIISSYSFNKRILSSWVQKDFFVTLANCKIDEEKIQGILTSGLYDINVDKDSDMILNHIPITLYIDKFTDKFNKCVIEVSIFKKISLKAILRSKSEERKDPFFILKEWFGNKIYTSSYLDITHFLLCTQETNPIRLEPTLSPSLIGNMITMANIKNISGKVFISLFHDTVIYLNKLQFIKSDHISVKIEGKLIVKYKGKTLELPVELSHLNHSIKRLTLIKPVMLPESNRMNLNEVLENFNLRHPIPSLVEEHENYSKKEGGVILKHLGMVIGTTDGFFLYPTIQVDDIKIGVSKNHKYQQKVIINEKIILENVETFHENMAVSSGYNPGVKMSVSGKMNNHPLGLRLQVSTDSFYKEKSKCFNVNMTGNLFKFFPSNYETKNNWNQLFKFINLDQDLENSIPKFLSDEIVSVNIVNFSFSVDRKNKNNIFDVSLVLKLRHNLRHGSLIPGLKPLQNQANITYYLDKFRRTKSKCGLEIKFKLYGKTVQLSPNKKNPNQLEMIFDRFSFNFGESQQKDFFINLPVGALIYEHGMSCISKIDPLIFEKEFYMTHYTVDILKKINKVTIKGYLLKSIKNNIKKQISNLILTFYYSPYPPVQVSDPILRIDNKKYYLYFKDRVYFYRKKLKKNIKSKHFSDIIIICKLYK